MVFANSRLQTELLLTYLQQANPQPPGKPQPIRGYRGGYLPSERREIERGLRDGQIRGVVSTNALELGIDVGSLDAAVMAGYPGTIASTWQRAGRAGRRAELLRGAGGVLGADRPIHRAPSGLFLRQLAGARLHTAGQSGNPGESSEMRGVRAADCAPMKNSAKSIAPIYASDWRKRASCICAGEHWHWTEEAYPADAVSLRAVTCDNFVIVDMTGAPEVIGEVDFSSALTTVHPKAIYLHGGAAVPGRTARFQGAQEPT